MLALTPGSALAPGWSEMDSTATLRFRRATALLALAWALAALGLSLVPWLGPGPRLGPPFLVSGIPRSPWSIRNLAPSAAAAGLEAGDRLEAIDGTPIGKAILDWEPRFRPDALNLYRLHARDGGDEEVALRPVPSHVLRTPLLTFVMLALPFVGLIYLATGLAVWRLRRDRTESWALLLFCSTMATDLFFPAMPTGAAWVVRWLNLPIIGATAFHLFTTYPVEPAWAVRHRGLQVAPYLGAAVLGPLAAFEAFLGVQAGVFKASAFYFTMALALACFIVLTRERTRLRDTAAAGRFDVMFLGALVSFLPATLVLMAQNFLQTTLPWHVAFLWFFLFPIAVGYGIVRRQLFEIRLMAKSSAAYGAATLAITGLYALLITFADAVVSHFDVNARSPWFSVGFLFCAILAFNPLRNRMQRLVDRVFDRDRALYRGAVREISEAMVSMLSTKEIVDRILVALTDTMGVERAMVLLLDEEKGRLVPAASRGDWDDESLSTEIATDHPLCQQVRAGRLELFRSDFDDESDPEVREACRDVFDTLEVQLVVPISYGADLRGLIAVGRKLSGERLAAEDRELLRTLSNQSSIAIENAKAFDEIAKLNATLEARVEERTRELQDAQAQLVHSEKMASLGQLVAGIAHELNNPIGFVHANLKLLDEYIPRLLRERETGEDTARSREAIERLLARSREGTERVKKIVEDLRVFSRMDRAELREADLNEEIDRTLTLMEPRLKAGIRVERDYAELPRVRGYIAQLNQVFMNLLMNACDAIGEHGTIRVQTRRMPSGVRLEFEDNGPGIASESARRIFEPFFTTKPVGKGTGLGLSLSHGIIEKHGGRIWAEAASPRGARFVIELPLDATPGDA